MSQVRLLNVSKKYDGGILTMERLDLTVNDGGFVVVAEPSSYGKSTTLRMVVGLEIVAGSEIVIGKHVVNDARPQDRSVAMVLQSYALYPHMTAHGNMSFELCFAGGNGDGVRDRVENTAEMLEISELLDGPLKQLSGGQQQRVALRRVIACGPDVPLTGESLSNLDVKPRMQIRTEIQRIQEDPGATTVYVIHGQTETMTMVDRVVVLNSDKLQQVGPPGHCYDEPNNEFVAGLTGSPSMNSFEVIVTGDDDGVHFESSSFEFTLDVDIPSGEYTLGVRPEGLMPDCEGGYAETAVDVVGPAGSDDFLYLQTTYGSSEVVMRVESEPRPAIGDEITLGLDVDDMHLLGSDDARVVVSGTRPTDFI